MGEGMWRRGAALGSCAASSSDDPPIYIREQGPRRVLPGRSTRSVFSWSSQVRARGTRWKAKLGRGAAWGKGNGPSPVVSSRGGIVRIYAPGRCFPSVLTRTNFIKSKVYPKIVFTRGTPFAERRAEPRRSRVCATNLYSFDSTVTAAFGFEVDRATIRRTGPGAHGRARLRATIKRSWPPPRGTWRRPDG